MSTANPIYIKVWFYDGPRRELVDIKIIWSYETFPGSQAMSLSRNSHLEYTAVFKEPKWETLPDGTTRPGVEDIDFIHEVFGHIYTIWKKRIKNNFYWVIWTIFNAKKDERQAREQEQRENVIRYKTESHPRGRLNNIFQWNLFRSTL